MKGFSRFFSVKACYGLGFCLLFFAFSAKAGWRDLQQSMDEYWQDSDKGKLIQSVQKHTPDLLAEFLKEVIKPSPASLSGAQLQGKYRAEIQIKEKPGSPSFPMKKEVPFMLVTLRAGWVTFSTTCDLEVDCLNLKINVPFVVSKTEKGYSFLEQFLSGATHRIDQIKFKL